MRAGVNALLPAFASRNRSESCSGSIDAVPTARNFLLAKSTAPAIFAARPRIVRRSSSTGDLASSSLTPLNPITTVQPSIETTPKALKPAPSGRKYYTNQSSLPPTPEYEAADPMHLSRTSQQPLHPAQSSQRRRRPSISMPVSLPPTPEYEVSDPLSALGVLGNSQRYQSTAVNSPRRIDSLPASPSPLRPKPTRSRAPSANIEPRVSTSSNRPALSQAESFVDPAWSASSRSQTPRASNDASLSVLLMGNGKQQQAELDLSGRDGAVVVLQNASDVSVEWKCVCVPATANAAATVQWEMRITRNDTSRTPTPFSPATFSSTPSLSPHSAKDEPSPKFASPFLRTPEPATSSAFPRSPVPPRDVFWDPPRSSNRSGWPTSPSSSDGEDDTVPLTPKRMGHLMSSPPSLSDGFGSTTARHNLHGTLSPPRSPNRRKFSYGRSPRPLPLIVRDSDSESDGGYGALIGSYASVSDKPESPIVVPPQQDSPTLKPSLAQRRVGLGKAHQMQLGLGSLPEPNRSVKNQSRWSETEEEEETEDEAVGERRLSSSSASS